MRKYEWMEASREDGKEGEMGWGEYWLETEDIERMMPDGMEGGRG